MLPMIFQQHTRTYSYAHTGAGYVQPSGINMYGTWMLERVQDDLNHRVSACTCVAAAIRVRVYICIYVCQLCGCTNLVRVTGCSSERSSILYSLSLYLYATCFPSGHNCVNLILFKSCPFLVKFIVIHENCNNPISKATLWLKITMYEGLW